VGALSIKYGTYKSRPHSGLDLQVKVLKPFQVVPFSVGSGWGAYRAVTWVRFRAKKEQLKRIFKVVPEKWLKSRPESGLDCLMCAGFRPSGNAGPASPVIELLADPTSPHRGSKSSCSNTWVCTTGRRIPASASRNQGPDKRDLITRR